MKRKIKKKIGGDVCLNCSDWRLGGDDFCRKWTRRRGGHGEVENTICERDTGKCVKPMSDGARRQLISGGNEEETENRQLVDDFGRELFGDEDEENESSRRTLPWGLSRGGRKTFRRKNTRKKKKIGGYNSCLNFDEPDKYCQNIYKTLAHLKGKTQCDRKTGDCIEPGFKRRNSGDIDDSDNGVDWGDAFEIDDGDANEPDHQTSKPIKSARKKNSYSTSNYEGKLKSNLYIGGKKKYRKKTKKNKKKLKSRKKTRNSRKNRRKSRK